MVVFMGHYGLHGTFFPDTFCWTVLRSQHPYCAEWKPNCVYSSDVVLCYFCLGQISCVKSTAWLQFCRAGYKAQMTSNQKRVLHYLREPCAWCPEKARSGWISMFSFNTKPSMIDLTWADFMITMIRGRQFFESLRLKEDIGMQPVSKTGTGC